MIAAENRPAANDQPDPDAGSDRDVRQIVQIARVAPAPFG
jgi:hypothetical protein